MEGGLSVVFFISFRKASSSPQIAGTTWVWSEEPITWTFTFSENEVTFDYRAEFSPSDITTDQYKSTYEYISGNIAFNMTVWSGIEWKFTGPLMETS